MKHKPLDVLRYWSGSVPASRYQAWRRIRIAISLQL